MMQNILQKLPAALVILRFCLAPVLLIDAWDGQTTDWFLAAFVTGFVSDIVDGMIARRLKVSTAQLRQADSWADVCFYCGVFVSTWLVHPDTVIAFRLPLLVVAVSQLSLYLLSWLKFKKFPSYHTYTAKAWGISLFIATVSLFGWNYAGWSLWGAIVVGLINTFEEITITLILPEWKHDVLSIAHALQEQTLKATSEK